MEAKTLRTYKPHFVAVAFAVAAAVSLLATP